MAYEMTNPFSVCFNIMKMKYVDYDRSLDGLDFLLPTDKVNVFINLETVFNHLTMIRDIDKKILLERDFSTIITSDILNLAAHYKRFFKGNGLHTRVFLYTTDFQSDDYYQTKFNEDYRSYFKNKYTSNPRYSFLGEQLTKEILPDSKTICQFCPDIHLIISNNIDGSLVPFIIGEQDPSYKNLIIGGDIYETQYIFHKKYIFHYLRKTPLYSSVSWTLQGYLKEIYKREVDQTTEVNLFSNLSFYLTLLSCLGEKNRSVDDINRFGPVTVGKLLQKGINENVISHDASSIELISKLFPLETQEELITNFHCLNMEEAYKNLTEYDIFSITSQIENRFDNNSLIQLNNTRFYHYPLILEALTM